jgi:hypothetical protein
LLSSPRIARGDWMLRRAWVSWSCHFALVFVEKCTFLAFAPVLGMGSSESRSQAR